jgi:predicted TIM-barrel fold metal-dependent hydrolase
VTIRSGHHFHHVFALYSTSGQEEVVYVELNLTGRDLRFATAMRNDVDDYSGEPL